MTLRGIGSNASTSGADLSVTMQLDGVYLARSGDGARLSGRRPGRGAPRPAGHSHRPQLDRWHHQRRHQAADERSRGQGTADVRQLRQDSRGRRREWPARPQQNHGPLRSCADLAMASSPTSIIRTTRWVARTPGPDAARCDSYSDRAASCWCRATTRVLDAPLALARPLAAKPARYPSTFQLTSGQSARATWQGPERSGRGRGTTLGPSGRLVDAGQPDRLPQCRLAHFCRLGYDRTRAWRPRGHPTSSGRSRRS